MESQQPPKQKDLKYSHAMNMVYILNISTTKMLKNMSNLNISRFCGLTSPKKKTVAPSSAGTCQGLKHPELRRIHEDPNVANLGMKPGCYTSYKPTKIQQNMKLKKN